MNFLRLLLLLIPILVSDLAFASRGTMQADGIIKVRGADATRVIVTVVPGDAPSYSLPIGTKHFTLSLPVDAVYLIRVEREGCPSKEIYVDATVPVEFHTTNFQFPFLVTLQHVAPENMFAYAGPVGFVRYVYAVRDFGYETDLSVHMDKALQQRMVAVRATGVDPRVFDRTYAARAVVLPRGSYSAPSGQLVVDLRDIAPVVSEVPELVHVISREPGSEDPELASPIAPKPMTTTRVVRSAIAAPTLHATVVRVPEVERYARTIRVLEAIVPDGSNTSSFTGDVSAEHMNTTSSTIQGSGEREDELIIEPRRVTRVLRMKQPSGSITEFRKVTHAFGATFYFKNMNSITERAFEEALAR